jgi:competence protein ComFC
MPWSGELVGDRCLSCQKRPTRLDWADAWGHYRGSLESVLHAYKFERHDFLDDDLAELLSDLVYRHDDSFDAVIAVPMHASKLRRRGYNQSELLARSLSRRIGVAFRGDLLMKSVDRKPQSTLPRSERAGNVRGAFAASRSVAGLSVLLIDDISTTGETLRACARALRRQRATTICALTVARA